MKYLIFFGVILFIGSFLYLNWESSKNSQFYPQNSNALSLEEPNHFVSEMPKGNELEINIRKLSNTRFNIKITNVSNKKIFCPYLPGVNRDKANYFPYITEKEENGKFIVESKGGDFAPGLNPINPNNSVEFTFFSIKKGKYRIKFSYLIDENIAQLINNSTNPNSITEAERVKINTSYLEITTPVMVVDLK